MQVTKKIGRYSRLKEQHPLPSKLEDLMNHMVYSINSDKGSKVGLLVCNSKRKLMIEPQFERAFNTLTKPQQISLFTLYLQSLQNFTGQKVVVPTSPQLKDKCVFDVLVREGTFSHTWRQHKVQVDTKLCRVVIVGNERYSLDLHDYLIRKSKAKDKCCFVLQSTKQNMRKTLRIGFNTYEQFQECRKVVALLIAKALSESIKQMMQPYLQMRKKVQSPVNTFSNMKLTTKTSQFSKKNSHTEKPETRLLVVPQVELKRQPTLVDELIEQSNPDLPQIIEGQNDFIDQYEQKLGSLAKSKGPVELLIPEDAVNKAQRIFKKKNLDIFHRLMPSYELQDIEDDSNFRLAKNLGKYRLLQHISKPKTYKLIGSVQGKYQDVLAVVLDIGKYKHWNEQVEVSNMKNRIVTENSAILYQKHKSYSQFYKCRDFLYLRHVFAQGQHHYIIDKSIQNSNYPPFASLIRGDIKYCLWCLIEKPPSVELRIQIQIHHSGYLTVEQQESLTYRYLTGITNIESFTRSNQTKVIDKCFDLSWDIGLNQLNLQTNRSRLQKNKSTSKQQDSSSLFSHDLCSQLDDQKFYTAYGDDSEWDGLEISGEQQIAQVPIKEINQKMKEQKHQIPDPAHETHNIEPNFDYNLDQQGLSILPKAYLDVKHKMFPLKNSEYKPVVTQFKHPIWKDQWKLVHQDGLHFIHQKKLAIQKGIVKYIISKLGKNILSGKGVTGISLPIDIFNAESNLQRTARSMGLGPKVLQRAVQTKDQLERFKLVMAFERSFSLIYLSMEKPFNPILGETFQGWLNGCPVFCEQISHHPPIVSYFFQGRGYKVYGNMQSKMQLSVNSGTGINYGEYIVQFEDTKHKVRFRTPGGQVGGISFGPRTFNFKGKAHIYCYQTSMFCQLSFNPSKKGLFSIGKQQKQADFYQGNIVTVNPSWMQQFRLSLRKSDGPSAKHITATLANVQGLWTNGLQIDGKFYYDPVKDIPCIIQYEKYPLNSNSNYRQDIIFLKKGDVARAQQQKERLQNIQRADRKLREKFHKKKH